MSFVWVTHQVASTRWLKKEIGQRAPALKFAFARPGLTTWKADAADETVRVPSSFARAWGLSLGRATNVAEVLALVGSGEGRRLHVWERDIDVPVDEQDQAVRGTRAAAVEAELRAAGGFVEGTKAVKGERVLDVIVPHASEPDEPWLVGAHLHDDEHGPWPGGVQHVAPPAESPSRAWCKIEEALRWGDLQPRKGDIAVELGSSPGGASFALLERGLVVHGVDPGEMDPRVLAHPHFKHHHLPAAEVEKKDLPRRYQWLLNDINLAPMVALRYVERFVALAHGGLKGAVLTLKLNDDGVFDALPRLVERIAKMGPKHIRVTQLPSHRSEVAAICTW